MKQLYSHDKIFAAKWQHRNVGEEIFKLLLNKFRHFYPASVFLTSQNAWTDINPNKISKCILSLIALTAE